MRIADILSSHLEPGALVVDLTPASAEISEHTRLPPQLGLAHATALPASRFGGLAIVLQTLPVRALDVPAIAARVAQVVFFAHRAAPIEHGLLEQLATAGWELLATHTTGHTGFPFALVAAPSEQTSTPLRILNEYRFDKLLMREQDADLQRALLHQSRHAARLDEALNQITDLETRLAERDAELAALRLATVAARQDAADQAARVHRAEADLTESQRQLAKTRGGVSLRLGRWKATIGDDRDE